MSVATAELVRLIDLSLGSEPSGVVNFNYLHALMHAIVGRLGTMEVAHLGGEYAATTIDGGGGVERGGTRTGGGGGVGATATAGTGGSGGDMGGEPSGAPEKKEETDGTRGGEETKKETTTPPPVSAGGDPADPRVISGTPSGRASRAGVPESGAHRHRPVSSFVTAANDLGAMERKLQEFESRLNAMDTLPELLERKSSDMGATPIKDRWNFTNLSKRLSAAEDGLEQV